MFFFLSKIAFALIAPSNLCFGLIGGGLVLGFWRRYAQFGRRLALIGFAGLAVFGFSPVGKWLIKPLDDRFANATMPAEEYVTHIVLLGGFEQAVLSRGRDALATNAAAERLLAIPVLARRYPNAKIVFSGGYGWLVGERLNAVRFVTEFLIGAGVQRERLVLEGKARNTWQNALYVRELLKTSARPCPCGTVLVTSAWHMPRAVGVFRQAGFAANGNRLFPMPVDFRTAGKHDQWLLHRWFHEGLELSDLAVKEWVGLTVYAISERSASVWPAPQP